MFLFLLFALCNLPLYHLWWRKCVFVVGVVVYSLCILMYSLFNSHLQTERDCSLSEMSFCLVSNDLDANNGVKRCGHCVIGCLKRLTSIQVELELCERKWTFTHLLSPFIHPHSCSFDAFLSIIYFFLQPMKALWASAGTSQPVLSSQQVQTVFYQVPEIRDIHQSFSSGLKARLSAHCLTESCPGGEEEVKHSGFSLMVGDLFLKMVSSPHLNWGCYFSVEHFYRVSSSHEGKRFEQFRQQNTRVCITCCRIVREITQKYGLIMTKMSSLS